MELNPNLTYIILKDCERDLIEENNLQPENELLILASEYINEDDIIYKFDYQVFLKNGTKIKDISTCENYKLELSSPINDEEIIENALELSEQGYDIFNTSSSFYYDICISVQINDCDLTLSVRQNDIMPDNFSLCFEGCIYNGVNLTNKRISCLCDYNYNQNKTNNNEIKEVEENFLIYLLDMINYPVVVCYKLFFSFKNYFYNFGFYIGVAFFALIIALCIIYCIFGQKSITLQYLSKTPKYDDLIKTYNKNNQSINKSFNRNQHKQNTKLNLQENSLILTNRRRSKKAKATVMRNKNKLSSLKLKEPPKRTLKNINAKINKNKTIIAKNNLNFKFVYRNSIDQLVEKDRGILSNKKRLSQKRNTILDTKEKKI